MTPELACSRAALWHLFQGAEALEKQEDLGGIVVVEGRVVGQGGVAVAGKDGTQGDQTGTEIGGFVGLAVELVECRPELRKLDPP